MQSLFFTGIAWITLQSRDGKLWLQVHLLLFKFSLKMHACMFLFFYFCWHVLQVYDLNCSVAWGIMQPFLIWVWCRVVLRCRQLARERFAKLRSDVLVKLELLDQKHGESLCIRISLFVLCNFGTTLGKDWGHFLPFFTQCSLG